MYINHLCCSRALVLAMRAIGKGHQAAETLSGFLDMPKPVNARSWKNHHDTITENVRKYNYLQFYTTCQSLTYNYEYH
jgi:hypothetical protein